MSVGTTVIGLGTGLGWRARARLSVVLGGLTLGAFGGVAPVLLALGLTDRTHGVAIGTTRPPVAEPRVVSARSVHELLDNFARRGYDLATVSGGQAGAPRLFLADLPRNWRDLGEAEERKRAFVLIALPLVLRANEQILRERARLGAFVRRVEVGQMLPAGERAWLEDLATRYEVSPHDLKALKRRVDIVPPSIAIAQAAIESGWGTSRFALAGNALYGQWTEEGEGDIVPAGRDEGRSYAIRRFQTLSESVDAYMRNLNSHRAYRKFRANRAELRRAGKPLAGAVLAEKLKAYSARGTAYVRALEAIIDDNGLAALDSARLES